MTFTSYLKGLLSDFVDYYQKYLRRTFGVTLVFTVLCFVGAALLLHFSDFARSVSVKQISLLNTFFIRYSKADTYSLVDLTKSVFLFFVALFSLGFTRLANDKTSGKFNLFIRKITLKDITFLLGIFILTSLIDYIFFKLERYSIVHAPSNAVSIYFQGLLFHLRIYVPLILFALTICSLTVSEKVLLTFKRILFLYISLWLFNEFAFEIASWANAHFLSFILLPFANSKSLYLYESILEIPLIAFFFLGYHVAMTTPIKQTEVPS
ncbi:hypothetical protein SAMN05518672_11227 [Chitinophaga sp. CF118]|uniref:hypothetical protein n=1 Tax=Chitinophaga sp. CF118 TaxID=1884367 RepID=UPI0008E4A28D|nr:hypothetical protein [Chitinophaga sp. CF118]SFE91319.1 hypothetical protein SAMN05518672_11227 [Chitinophaga sp. CF118]